MDTLISLITLIVALIILALQVISNRRLSKVSGENARSIKDILAKFDELSQLLTRGHSEVLATLAELSEALLGPYRDVPNKGTSGSGPGKLRDLDEKLNEILTKLESLSQDDGKDTPQKGSTGSGGGGKQRVS